jgi:hypothetical protein
MEHFNALFPFSMDLESTLIWKKPSNAMRQRVIRQIARVQQMPFDVSTLVTAPKFYHGRLGIQVAAVGTCVKLLAEANGRRPRHSRNC